MDDTIDSVAIELGRAKGVFEDKDKAYNNARSERTDALNALNEAQRRFDKVVTEIKKAAPRDSDWNRLKGIPHEQC